VTVLDASALLVYLQQERGAETVEAALVQGAHMSAVNLAEVLSKIASSGQDPKQAYTRLVQQGLLGGLLEIHSLQAEDGIGIAQLHLMTQKQGLSLGDRACLMLGLTLGFPVLTADRVWQRLDLGVEVRLVRT
jgi:ribonuclease VapC